METTALILITVVVLLLVMNAPIAVSIALATFMAVLAEGVDPSVGVAASMANGVNSFTLLAIPFDAHSQPELRPSLGIKLSRTDSRSR